MTDDEILTANDTYGSLGELAIMTLPKAKILTLFRYFRIQLSLEELAIMTLSKDMILTLFRYLRAQLGLEELAIMTLPMRSRYSPFFS